jgi:hypothetical protein
VLSFERRHLPDRLWSHKRSGGGSAPAPVETFTIWNDATIPAIPDGEDPDAVTLGCRFRSDVPGEVIGVRFYKGDSDNGGVHVGLLYDNVGTLLNSVNFAGETASGWQQQLFAAPTPILAGTTYVIAYFAPQGHYSVDLNYFTASGFDNPPLHALQDDVDGDNGIFTYGAVPTFPSSVFMQSNYWVDLVFRE